jgi:hypothetical protein
MSDVLNVIIPQAQTFEWSKFLTRRETYRDIVGGIRHSITFMDQCVTAPPVVKTGISVLKLGAPVSIRPDAEDIKEQVGLTKGALEHRNAGVLFQNAGRLTTRFLTALIAVTTVYSGFSSLRGGAYALPVIFTAVKEGVGELLSARSFYNGRCLETAMSKLDNDGKLLEWIQEQAKANRAEEADITLKYVGKADECKASITALAEQKKQWLRDAMGDAALKVALDPRLNMKQPDQVTAAANFIRGEIKFKKAANLCNMIKDIIPVLGVICLYRGGNIKKYASLCYAMAALISLPDAALHRRIAKHLK